MKLTVDVKNAQATEKTRGSDMVAEGMTCISRDVCYAWAWPVLCELQTKSIDEKCIAVPRGIYSLPASYLALKLAANARNSNKFRNSLLT